MELKRLKYTALCAPVIGSSLFLILTTFAMIFFAGGTSFDHNANGYSFFNNFFSDLGMLTAYSGDSNIISSTFFLLAGVSSGICMISYFIAIPSLFKTKKLDHFIILFGSLLGIIAAIGYIGIGFAPWDKSPESLSVHMFFVYLSFTITLPVVILYVFVFLRNNMFPKKLSYVYISLGLILLAYIYLLFFGPTTSTEKGRIIQVVGQKIIVYAEILTFLIQGLVTSRYYLEIYN